MARKTSLIASPNLLQLVRGLLSCTVVHAPTSTIIQLISIIIYRMNAFYYSGWGFSGLAEFNQPILICYLFSIYKRQ